MRTLFSILIALGRILEALARIEQRQETTMGIIEDIDGAVQALVPAVNDLSTAAANLEARIQTLGLTAEQQATLQGDLDTLRNAASTVAEVTSGLNASDQPAPAATEPPAAPVASTEPGSAPGADGTEQTIMA